MLANLPLSCCWTTLSIVKIPVITQNIKYDKDGKRTTNEFWNNFYTFYLSYSTRLLFTAQKLYDARSHEHQTCTVRLFTAVHWVILYTGKRPSTPRTARLSASLSTINPTWTGLGKLLSLCGERPTTAACWMARPHTSNLCFNIIFWL
jgi:hypothetical protein